MGYGTEGYTERDILTEMQRAQAPEVREVQEAAEYIDEGPTAAREEAKRNAVLTEIPEKGMQVPPGATIAAVQTDAQVAELALLRHLALEGELAMRRDTLQAEHAAVTQRLAQARQQRQALVEAVQEAGGELPRWTL